LTCHLHLCSRLFFYKFSKTIKYKIESKKKILNTYISRLNIEVFNKIENLYDMPISYVKKLLLFLIVYFVLLFYKKNF